MNNPPRIAIVGLGMVGMPLARYFRERAEYKIGIDLLLYDIDPQKQCADDFNRADIIFLCVPTPRATDGSADLAVLEQAFSAIKGSKIIVIKSTVPPGTTEYFQNKYPRHNVLFNPEFLTEAAAWEQTRNPERQLVGWTHKSKDVTATVLALLPRGLLCAPSPVLELTATEAEIIKYAGNVFLARKVVFANAIYDLAEGHGADYERIRAGLAADARIGPSHLNVRHGGYRGYGGNCFIKDTDALIAHCADKGIHDTADLIRADRTFNERLLARQGLRPEDVAVHDHEKIRIQHSYIS